MNKAILTIDSPKNCVECDLSVCWGTEHFQMVTCIACKKRLRMKKPFSKMSCCPLIQENREKDKYIFYSKGTNHDNADDVAITEADSLEEAVDNFKKYYSNVSANKVQIINCHREGSVENMMIVSDY